MKLFVQQLNWIELLESCGTKVNVDVNVLYFEDVIKKLQLDVIQALLGTVGSRDIRSVWPWRCIT